MSAAAAPRKPKKGAVSSPLKVEVAMGGGGGEDGAGSLLALAGGEEGRGQATTQLLRFAWICLPPRFFFFLVSVDWNCHGQEQKYNNIPVFLHALMGRD